MANLSDQEAARSSPPITLSSTAGCESACSRFSARFELGSDLLALALLADPHVSLSGLLHGMHEQLG